jgi:hypothetical protein
VFAIIAAGLIWWLRSFMEDHLITDPEQAAVVAEEIVPITLPEGMSFEQAFSWNETQAAWGVEPDSPNSTLVVFVFRTDEEGTDEDSLLKGFEQSRKRGREDDFLRFEDFDFRGEKIQVAVSEYSDGNFEYAVLLPAESTMTGMIFMGPPETTTHEWVQEILDTAKN